MQNKNNIISLARSLRRNQTPSEAILWNELRARRFLGYKFLRQHPITYSYYQKELFFIADFYCAEAQLVIEVDGEIHKQQLEHDKQRDLILKEKGLTVMRIKNEELDNIDLVKRKIASFLQ